MLPDEENRYLLDFEEARLFSWKVQFEGFFLLHHHQ